MSQNPLERLVSPRVVRLRYGDPLDLVWRRTVEKLGFAVDRTSHAYATTDGRGTISVGTADTLDADDSLAQILFHELCHALVQGEERHKSPDWGLDNETERDAFREHASLRLQAALASRHGLRAFLAPTTDYRAFYDALPDDALAPLDSREMDECDPSIALARVALGRADTGPWRAPLDAALRATAQIAALASPFAQESDLVSLAPRSRAGRHPTGAALGPVAEACGGCAWFARVDDDPKKPARCRQWRVRVREETPSCEAFEPELDCQACGGCCREAYGAVEISPREAVRDLHPHLIVLMGGQLAIARAGERCAALHKDGADRYACTIYDDRPKTCREFERGGRHCLDARQRLGLSFKAPTG